MASMSGQHCWQSLLKITLTCEKCVDNNQQTRARTNYSNPQEVAIFSAHSKTKKIAGHMDHDNNMILQWIVYFEVTSKSKINFFNVLFALFSVYIKELGNISMHSRLSG
jgi:hypothetical protein